MIGRRRLQLGGLIVKLALFTAFSLVLTIIVVASLLNLDTAKSHTYTALFADASSLQSGDAVRIAGVEVGRVKHVSLTPTAAKVTFTVDADQTVTQGSTLQIQFENLFGQRNLSISQGAPSAPQNPKVAIAEKRTTPALDLTTLFNGFSPLFQALTPSQINTLTGNIVAAFQGEGGSIDTLVTQTAQLTTNLSDREQVIDGVVNNLTQLLTVAGNHDAQIGQLVDSFSALATALAGDRGNISNTLGNLSNLTGSLDGLVSQLQPPLESSVHNLVGVTGALAQHQAQITGLIDQLPITLSKIAGAFSSGTFANVYLCQLSIVIKQPLYFTPVQSLNTVLGAPAAVASSIVGPLESLLGTLTFPAALAQGGVNVPSGPTGNPALHTANCA